jgi:hypothetical protein
VPALDELTEDEEFSSRHVGKALPGAGSPHVGEELELVFDQSGQAPIMSSGWRNVGKIMRVVPDRARSHSLSWVCSIYIKPSMS